MFFTGCWFFAGCCATFVVAVRTVTQIAANNSFRNGIINRVYSGPAPFSFARFNASMSFPRRPGVVALKKVVAHNVGMDSAAPAAPALAPAPPKSVIASVAYAGGRKIGDVPLDDISEVLKQPGTFVW